MRRVPGVQEELKRQTPRKSGNSQDIRSLISFLKNCAKTKDFRLGASVHVEILQKGHLRSNPFVGSTLISMYAKCGTLGTAEDVFEALPSRGVVPWNAIIGGYAQSGHEKEALDCLERMQLEGLFPNAVTFICILKACSTIGILKKGEYIHLEIVRQGIWDGNAALNNTLVDMYAKCGEVAKAKEMLDGILGRDVVGWNALISGYVKGEHSKQALNCFEQMQHEGLAPNAVTYASILKACSSAGALEVGERIHFDILRQELLGDPVLGGALVDMYAKCGAIAKAKEVLDGLPFRNVISWSSLITGYAQGGHIEEALSCLERMQDEGLSPNAVTFTCILKACTTIRALDKGQKIHSEILELGLLSGNVELGNSLVDFYAKCGELSKAKDVLLEIPFCNVVSYNALISGHVEEEHNKEALDLFEQMQDDGIMPDAVTFSCILKAFGSMQALDKGEQIHSDICKQGLLDGNVELGGALVDLYVKCGAVAKAKEVLEGLPVRDVVSWSALIAGYAEGEHCEEALNCFYEMLCEGIIPDVVTLACMLKVCGIMEALNTGGKLHLEIARQGLLDGNVLIGNALVDMYAKCGLLLKAMDVFEGLPVRSVVSWNALMTGYAQKGHGKEILSFLEQMQHEGLFPDVVTFACSLKVCGSIQALESGKKLHHEIVARGLLSEGIVLGNALIDMYAKCGALSKAKEVHKGLPVRDVISWSALIAGLAQSEHGKEALECFEFMQRDGLAPNAFTFSCILKICGSLGALDKGQDVHSDIVRQNLLTGNVVLGDAVVDMYAKCGAFVKAKEVFDGLPVRDVVSWNALIVLHADGEHGREALKCFEQMQYEGIPPDETTFLCILKACSHFGLLDEGQKYFLKMSVGHGLTSKSEHQTCMVNLFGSVGLIDNAVAAIHKMPCVNSPILWLVLLNACKKWGNVVFGRWAFEYTVHLDMKFTALYA